MTLTTLTPVAAIAGHPACEPDVSPLAVMDQRLYRHDGLLVVDVLVANVAPGALQDVHVSVELYDFFGELLRAERTVMTPTPLSPGYRATFRVVTPFTQDVRKIAYRFTGLRASGTFQSLVVCDAAL